MTKTFDIDVHHAPTYDPPVEFVERKGSGHPDTICDTLAEGLAVDLAKTFLAREGRLRHFNVDKALLSAGQVRLGNGSTPFGGGEVVRPTRIVLAGKVDARGGMPPLGALTRAAYDRLQAILPWATLPGDYDVDIWLQPSSDDLLPVLARGAESHAAGHAPGHVTSSAPLANDTSFTVVSLPRSPLEAAVLDVERAIAHTSRTGRLPVGADVKVMGVRRGNDVQVTVAAAILVREVLDAAAYAAAKERVGHLVDATVRAAFDRTQRHLGDLQVHVNRADLGPEVAYVTLTGSSAEAGDDGQVGRGNRVGGLITPHRSMSIEAACGKNPLGHVGKLHHAIAWDAAEAVTRLPGVAGTTVRLLSRIGHPVDQPVAVDVDVQAASSSPVDVDAVRAAVHGAIADWQGASNRLIDGHYPLA